MLEKVLTIPVTAKSSMNQIKAYNTLGSCYSMLNDNSKALEYYKKSYDNFNKYNIDDKKLESKILFNLALCSKKVNSPDDTLLYINKLLLMNEYEESAFINGLIMKANLNLESRNYEEALELYKLISTYGTKYIHIVQHNAAVAFLKLNRVDESIDYLTKSINAQLSLNLPIITLSLIDLGSIYKIENLYKPAIIFYEHAFNSALKFNQVDEVAECFENLIELYSKTKSEHSNKVLLNKMAEFYNIAEFENQSQMEKIKIYIPNYNIK